MDAVTKKPEIQRIRGPNLALLVRGEPGVPMVEALRLADTTKTVIASNYRISKAYDDAHDNPDVPGWNTSPTFAKPGSTWLNAFPCLTGTMTGYVQPGRTFRQETERISSLGNGYFIVYTDSKTKIRYLFPVNEEYLDKKDCILAVNHPDFELVKDGRDKIVRAAQIDLIEGFPAIAGWYRVDSKYELPTLKRGDSNLSSRELERTDKRVGLVVRVDYHPDDRDYTVFSTLLYHAPSDCFGVAVEVADGGIIEPVEIKAHHTPTPKQQTRKTSIKKDQESLEPTVNAVFSGAERNLELMSRILVIAPHADDLEIGCGGTVKKALQNGAEVFALLVAGTNIDKIKGETRQKEFAKGCKALGITKWDVLFRDPSSDLDSRLDTIPMRDIVNGIERVVTEWKPDTVFVTLGGYHQDHKAVEDATLAALRPSRSFRPKNLLLYEQPTLVWGKEQVKPKLYVDITGQIDSKIHALAKHKSQMDKELTRITTREVRKWAEFRGMEVGCRYAEAFEIVRLVI